MSAQGGQGEWRPDPEGKHDLRWWDGSTWSDQVSDGGVVSTDPMTSPGAGNTVAIPIAVPPPAPGTPAGAPPPVAVPVAGSAPPPPGAPIPGAAAPPPGAPAGAAGGGPLPPGAPGYVHPSSGGSGRGGVPKWVWIVGAVVGLLVLIGVVVVLVGGGSSFPYAEFDAGECTNDDLEGDVEEIDTVDCDDEHDAEAVGQFELEGDDDDYPDEDEILEEVSEECVDIFEDYVGTDYDESNFNLNYIPPSEDAWEEGARAVVCIIDDTVDGEDLEGSAEGSEE